MRSPCDEQIIIVSINGDLTVADMMQVIREAGSGAEGTTADPRITNVFFWCDRFAMMARDMMAKPKFGGKRIPMFETMDAALQSIRSGALANA